MNELQTKTGIARLEVKGSREDGALKIKAYALAFNNVDAWDDIIVPTACDKYLASEESKRTALCYQHDLHTIIGKITDKGVDEVGMWIEAEVLPTQVGKDVIILMKAGAIKEFSIGYFANEYHYEDRDGKSIRILDAISIFEVSPVTIAANPKAVLVSAKNDPTPDAGTDTGTQTNEGAKVDVADLEAMTDEELADYEAKLDADKERLEQEYNRRILVNL